MKQTIIGIAALAFITTACNNSSDTNTTSKKDDTSHVAATTTTNETASSGNTNTNGNAAVNEMLGQYLQIKNGLANDNGNEAATAGNGFVAAISKVDKASLTGNQKKAWDDVADDAKEMAEHIGKNANKIDHQREHFDMLSADMYDLVKAFGAGQTLYKDFCPMYNNNKGASWLSETKEIKNPYMGKKQPDCGSVKEEIKK